MIKNLLSPVLMNTQSMSLLCEKQQPERRSQVESLNQEMLRRTIRRMGQQLIPEPMGIEHDTSNVAFAHTLTFSTKSGLAALILGVGLVWALYSVVAASCTTTRRVTCNGEFVPKIAKPKKVFDAPH